MSQRVKIIIGILILAVGGWFAARLLGSSAGIPTAFTDARLEGAVIAQNIVSISNQSVQGLEKISELDREGKNAEAVSSTLALIGRSQEIRDEAIKLSGEVEKMTKALSDISSFEARQAALEAISNRLALLSRLVNYSGYLGQLLDALRNRFDGDTSGRAIRTLVDQINSEVNAINNFNKQAVDAMERFDRIVQ